MPRPLALWVCLKAVMRPFYNKFDYLCDCGTTSRSTHPRKPYVKNLPPSYSIAPWFIVSYFDLITRVEITNRTDKRLQFFWSQVQRVPWLKDYLWHNSSAY